MVERLLQLDDVRHIETPEKIAILFQKLGYNAIARPLAVDELELPGKSAEAIWNAYLIADQGKGALQVLLFQLQALEFSSPSIASSRMRSIAQSLGSRPSNFLLLGTKDYNQLMLVNPRKSFDAQMNLRTSIRKLLIDRTNPTNYDRERLEAIAAHGLAPQELYKVQCDAFDVEKLTKQFYIGYEKLFGSVQQVIQQHNPHPYFNDPSRLHQFTQRLLGRIMFLYFLQKKEFLGSDRSFLTSQYQKLQPITEPEGTEFYTQVLEPLFFETLNKQRLNNDSPWGQIPYLNGGLFDCDYGPGIKDAAGRNTPESIQLPNSLFDRTSANGILGFFNGYNFTVAENVQGDEDVAVDPEMLGKVFENQQAKEERGQSGTFYTPRGIVHFMCVEVLSRYLADYSGMSPDGIKQLIELDPDLPDVYFNKLLSKEQAKKIKQALKEVKCLDPAVGSAAFPLGMMQVILAVRQVIARREGMTVQRGSLTMSQWKRDIIANNLYGVDIKPQAIEIAKLRMWLSLVVDIPNIEDVEALPNLDYKLMCGDSLISTIHGEQLIPDPTKAEQQLMLNVTPIQQAIQTLLELQQQYYSIQSEERKALRESIIAAEVNVFRVATADRRQFWESEQRNLQQDIRRLRGKASRTQTQKQQMIAKKLAELDQFAAEVESGERSLTFFQYHLHFNDVFQEKGGFDIVIGNPPYGIVFNDYFKKAYEDEFATFKRNNDIYIAFYERAISLNNEAGYLSYITPNTFLNGDYFKSFRSLLTKKMRVVEIRDFKNIHIFDDPTVFVCVLNCNKQQKVNYPYLYISSVARDSISDFHVENVSINETTEEPLKQSNFILSQLVQQPFVKLLGELFHVKDIGFNYWTKGKGKKRDGNSIGDRVFYTGEQRNKSDIPFLKGRDIYRYHKKKPQNYLKHDYQQYLDKDADVFRYSGDLLKVIPKIIYRQTSSKIVGTMDYEANYLDKTLHLIVPKDNKSGQDLKFILALLNSLLFEYFYRYISQEEEGRAFSQVKVTYIKQLPIRSISVLEQKPFVEMVNKILNLTKNDNYLQNTAEQLSVREYEQQIDEMVFKLYKLTEEEIATVRRQHT